MTQTNSLKTLNGLQRAKEAGIFITCMLSLYLLLALCSFDPVDPGWSQSNYQGEIQNLTGAVGAWLADISFYFFGFSAFLIPVVFSAAGWIVFKQSYKLAEVDYFSVGLRLIGFLLIVLSLAALSSMNANDIYEFSAGGVTGDVIVEAMLPYFNQLGTTLLLLCFVGAGFTLLTGISWLTIVDTTGWATLWVLRKIASIPSLFRRSGDSQDTEGFMSVVDKVKQQRQQAAESLPDESSEESLNVEDDNDEVAERFAETPIAEAKESLEQQVSDEFSEALGSSQRIEPKISFADQEQTIAPPWSEADAGLDIKTETLEDDSAEIHFDSEESKGALSQVEREKNAEQKARIEDGIVILPGQEGLDAQVTYTKAPLPSISLLDVPNRKENPISKDELDQVARLVETKLADFNITAQVVGVFPGPVVTRFELELAPGIKASKITNLSRDLARSLLAESVRVVEVIPGKAYVGLELPNKFRETVFMRDVLDSHAFEQSKSKLSMVLGQDIAGEPVVVDLGKMPHLLVAGTTGSGKSVGVNVMITSLLYKSGPEDVRFIMIDPKMLELSVYEGIPHLLCEVVTDMKEASNALRWCVGEMERRYKLMSAMGVRNLKGFNAKVEHAKEQGKVLTDPTWKSTDGMEESAPELEKLPAIVVVVDEFADMMMIVGKKVEELIARIAQKARAAGIHLVLATQRPSVDVITGLIKANIPTRMAFQVSSKIDSRTILDQQGAETLLGMGDMLYQPPGSSVPVRVHGAFIDDHEVHKVVADWKARGKPRYIDEILQGASEGEQVLLPGETAESDEDTDALYDEAVAFVTETRRGSISSVQRKFKIGYNRAARIIEHMESQGVVSTPGHNGNRDVLAPPPPKPF
ncbi:DNA translocase FtsK [Shewanella gelidii]|uniref:DNA translocase FtsK n=1 Tax=Shewanella gelidii TaxID=1642821 RepID=A0A917JVE5_9GAMM|nr:DNA translocase FtsK [Shewanella gelidii]MCL1098018.1 DNA translocase FtsK 4TM domain-containing protein [Shewanella gelidii]GGI85477.1 DNA translocase FtsK [Shewanella gelidii]